MTHRAKRWLRPIAFLAATVLVFALWSFYRDDPQLSPSLPLDVHRAWLTPLYAIPRLPPDQVRSGMPARPAIDVWTSPVFDRLALASLIAFVVSATVCCTIARRTWMPVVLAIALGGTFLVNVFVARVPSGHQGVVEPFARLGLEYNTDTWLVKDDPIAFIRDYASLNRPGPMGMSLHAGTHPPGGVLFLYFGKKWLASTPDTAPVPPTAAAPRSRGLLESMFGGARAAPARRPPPMSEDELNTAAWLAISVAALAILPGWWLARSIGGAALGRRLLPLYIATPNLVLYGATCMDGVFLTFTLTALAAGVAASRCRWHWFWTPLSIAFAGVSLWFASFMTFAAVAVPLLMICYAGCAGIRDWRRGVAMLIRCVLVGVVYIVCQLAARHWLQYDVGSVVQAAMDRDAHAVGVEGYESYLLWRDYSLANLIAWLIGSGIAITGLAIVGLIAVVIHGRLRSGGIDCFAPALALCVLILSGSTLFTLETERVWLFLTPALLVVAASQMRGAFVWVPLIVLSFVQVFWFETQRYLYW